MSIENRKKIKVYGKNRVHYSEIIQKIKNERLVPIAISKHKNGK